MTLANILNRDALNQLSPMTSIMVKFRATLPVVSKFGSRVGSRLENLMIDSESVRSTDIYTNMAIRRVF